MSWTFMLSKKAMSKVSAGREEMEHVSVRRKSWRRGRQRSVIYCAPEAAGLTSCLLQSVSTNTADSLRFPPGLEILGKVSICAYCFDHYILG